MGEELAYKILWSRPALRDLENLLCHIARDNPKVAERFGRATIDKVYHLERHVQMGCMVPERNDSAYRQLIHSPFRIIYRVDPELRRVVILRIWHASRGEPEI